MTLSIKEYQALVDDWIQTFGVRYFSELTNLAQLVEEIGEVARIMARTYGDQSAKPGETPGDLADELADVLFVVACIANQTGIDLAGAIHRNMDKKTRRDKDRHRQNAKLDPDRTPCTVCGEMLRGTWTICPSCETPQGEPASQRQ